MVDLFEPILPDMIAEVERELAARALVYPRLVESGKSTQEKTDRQMQRMQGVLANLRAQL